MAEWGGLENRCTGNSTVGSNPTLSARLPSSNFAKAGLGMLSKLHLVALGLLKTKPVLAKLLYEAKTD